MPGRAAEDEGTRIFLAAERCGCLRSVARCAVTRAEVRGGGAYGARGARGESPPPPYSVAGEFRTCRTGRGVFSGAPGARAEDTWRAIIRSRSATARSIRIGGSLIVTGRRCGAPKTPANPDGAWLNLAVMVALVNSLPTSLSWTRRTDQQTSRSLRLRMPAASHPASKAL